MKDSRPENPSRRNFLTTIGVSLVTGLDRPRPSVAAAHPRPGVRLEGTIDVSGSLDGLDVAWDRLRAELPEIVETFQVETLSLSVFDVNGYVVRSLTQGTLAFSRLNEPTSVVEHEGEALTKKCQTYPMDNLRRMCLEQGSKELALRRQAARTSQDAARAQYRRSIRETLAVLDSLRVLPDRESTASDVVGALTRFTHIVDPGITLAILITDLADTRYPDLRPIPPPEADVRLLVLLVPAKPRDAARAWGRMIPTAEQYPWQVAQLQRAAPWARALPAMMTRGFAAYFPVVTVASRLSKTSPGL